MADGFAIGKALEIPDSVLKNIEQIDKKINDISKDSELMAQHFGSAMIRMGGDSENLLKKLRQIQALMGNMGNVNISGVSNLEGIFTKFISEAEKAISTINGVASALNKMGKVNVTREKLVDSKDIDLLNKEITALKKKTETLEKLVEKSKEQRKQESGQSAQTRANNKAIDAYNRAMASSEALVSQRINKIAKLRQAEEMLVKTGKDYSTNIAKIRSEIERLNKLNQGQVDSYGRIIKSQHNLMNTSDQLMRKLALIFSVSQIQGYLMNLVRVRGEFELQNTALASILNNKDKADRLFAQITELAVKSPFTVKELTTYTKSLSAYQVEYEKLYDTTKMLADVSAGLGVDMQRLILAFGQVKAANFLRGCLGYNTPVMLYDGTIKKVQDIKVGDVLINENGEEVNVLELIRGRETMYLVEQITGKDRFSYRVNRNHILTLWNVQEQRLEDVYVYDYLKNTEAYLGLKIVDGKRVYYDIEVTKDKIDDYYGFVLDGNKRFRLGDGTVTHNTETRQFTEAGINMIGELAKYYSELEGRVVSVTEVMDRQFKRMISFQDVEQVFKRLTAEGGMFYQMQERQAETLAGMMSNLQDRIDLMFNEIGKQNDGIIKGVIKIVQDLLANYDKVANVLEASVAIFGAYKVYVLLTKDALIQYALANNIVTAAGTKQLTVLQLLRVGFAKLATSVKATATAFKTFAASNPWLLALTAIATAIYEVVHWNDEYDEQLDEINKKHNSNAASLNKISEAYNKVAQSAREAAKSQEDFVYSSSDYKELFAQLQKLDEQLKDRGYTLPVNIQLVTPQNIDEVFKGGQELLQMANEFGAEFAKALASETTATEGWFNVFGDNLKTDLEELSDAYGEIGGAFKANLDIIQNEVVAISGELTGAAKEYYEELSKGKKENETETEWALRRVDILYKISKETKLQIKNQERLTQLQIKKVDISDKEREVQYELNKVLDSLVNKYGSLENLKKAYNDNPMIIKTEIDKQFEAMELGEQAKRFASFWAAQRLQIPIEFTTPKEMPTFFNDFRDTVKTLDTKGIFSKQLESLSTIADLEDMIQKKYKETVEYQEVLNRANTERLDLEKQILEQKEKLKSSDADERDAAQITINNLERQKSVIDQTIASAKANNQETIAIIKAIAEAFNLIYNPPTKKKSKDTTLQTFKEQLSFLEKVNKKYEELQKNYNDEEAKLRVINALKEEAKQKGVESIFMSAEFDDRGTLASMNALERQYLKIFKKLPAEMQKELAERVGGIELQLDIDVREDKVKAIQDQFSNLFGNYELSLELDKMGLDKNLASQLFDVEVFDLSELKEKINQEWIDLANELERIDAERENRTVKSYETIGEALTKFGDKQLEEYKAQQQKISEMEAKELEERLKKFSEYLKKTIDEAKRVQMEAAKDISFADLLFKTGKIDSSQYVEAIRQIQNEANKELSKINVNKFKESPEYIKAMGDMSMYSKNELKKLAEQLQKLISESAGFINASDLKVYQDALKNINEQINKIESPFDKSFIGQIQKAKELQEQYNAELERYNALLSTQAQKQLELKAAQDNLKNLEDKRKSGDNSLGLLEQIESAQNAVKTATQGLSGINNQLNISQGNLSNISSQMGSIGQGAQGALMMVDMIVKGVYQSINATIELFNEVKELADSFGADTEKGAWSDLTIAFNALGEVNEKVMGAWESFKSGDIIGASVKSIGAIFSVIKGINALHDNKREKEIKRQIELVENLQRSYEKLEQAIEDAYSLDTLKESTDKTIKNLKEQNDAYEKAIAAELDKKKTDDDRVKEWQNAIQENNDRINELLEESVSTATGGILDSLLSAASDFTDAWLESFREVGNGMQGLEQNFQEMLENMVKQQATMLITNQFLEDWKKQLSNYINADDLELTSEEAKKWVDAVKEDLPALNEALENYFKAMGEAGLDLGQGGDTMSELQKGIQSVSEETAQALESLLNSVRYFTSDSNTVLHNIYNSIAMPTAENPFLAEMKVQSSYLSNLNALVGSVVKTSSGKGKVLRVELA